MSLSSKTAIVTGASHGLGLAVAQLLHEKGLTVFALARSIEKTKLPAAVHKISCDLSDPTSIQSAFSQIDQLTPAIDILINCAGIALVKPFAETTQDELDQVMTVNLVGTMNATLATFTRMVAQKSGHIVNVGSTSSLRARDYEVVYCASKWGIRGFTESLRLEARPHGVRVSGVYPGGMNSANFWKDNPEKDTSSYIDPAVMAEEILHLLTIDPSISPAEIVLERNS